MTTSTGVLDMVNALKAAGFSGTALLTMTSLGICESGGNSQALNDNPSTGDYSVGWFQINYFNGLRADRTARYGAPQELLANPQAQAQAAWDLSGHGTSFQPWQGDFNNGKYYANLPAAAAAIQDAANTPGVAQFDPTTGAPTAAAPSVDATLLADSTGGTTSVNNCLIRLPSAGPIGGNCLLSRGQGRAIMAGGIMAAGAVTCLFGIGILLGHSVASGLGFTKKWIPDKNDRLAKRVEKRPPLQRPKPRSVPADALDSEGQPF